jgi:hypothetical protein
MPLDSLIISTLVPVFGKIFVDVRELDIVVLRIAVIWRSLPTAM